MSGMGGCCLKGVKHEGDPVGEHRDIAGTKSYLSYPPDKKTDHAILYLCDAFGLELVNNLLLADTLASGGYLVVAPDLFHGEPVPEDAFNAVDENGMPTKFDLFGWLGKHPKEGVEKVITATIDAMRNELGVKKIGAVGYCFGGKYVIRYLAEGRGLDAGFTAHPSLIEPGELEAVRGPLSIAAAEVDFQMSPDQRFQTEKTLEQLGKEHSVPYQLTLYGATEHGFAVRCDRSNPKQRYAMDSACTQALIWFDEHVK